MGRNDPCWCGSGIKYKKCHLMREHEPRPTFEEGKKLFKKAFDKKYCLHPNANKGECRGDIVKAHTIQRNGGLTRIEKGNHVYRFFPNIYKSTKEVVFETKLISIGKASTFTGFCNYHDTKTFDGIENYPFTGELNQIFLLAYRALAREVFMKKNHLETTELLESFDKGLSPAAQREFQVFLKFYSYGVALGVRTVDMQKTVYDKALLNADYSSLKYFVVFIDNCPDFLCSGATILEQDFDGNNFNQLGRSDLNQDMITFSIIPTDEGSAIVFATLDSGQDVSQFFNSLKSLSIDSIPNAITRYTFDFHENVFMSPTWWDSLNDDKKKGLISRAASGTRPDKVKAPKRLIDDGLDYINWNITKIISN
ncbi:MAG: SEC-C domain-containing protein [Nitrospirae bacterium]|nr:SEC-C domain-containing protein [Nitrospirota bacterium]